ncbi:MAG: carbamoyltransferase HypF [Anaerolineae bacterium]
MAQAGIAVHVTGVVQGVGFRPFVYGLATRLALTGWVRNTSAGVDIQVDGEPATLAEFVRALREQTPPLARIDRIAVQAQPGNGFTAFEIVSSEAIPDAFQPISPDVAVCPDCLRELFDSCDRRHRYPFINCTNCGPRFTIIQDIPYDRPKTTMAPFEMCPDCAAEYRNPLDRRFHAQPVACPVCGPQVWLETRGEMMARRDDAIVQAQRMLREGKILAVKGLGGFHLACDATNASAVAELRRRKLRVDKPFALMLADLVAVEQQCEVSAAERALLESRERPIVICKRQAESTIAAEVAPGQTTLGIMLPYTPLHYLLLNGEFALVMTSGNLSEDPIATDNDEARERLGLLADAFLMHDRGIHTRCDDSVVRVFGLTPNPSPEQTTVQERGTGGEVYPLRRSRGYAPFPVHLPFEAPPVLATGAELKNTFCITREQYAFLSHHIGDLENYETLRSFEDGVQHFERLFRVQPAALAYDLHPDYLATRYALDRAERDGIPAFGVQHHHAHIAACMAEHGLTGEQRVIGVAFDGTGYGEDGAIWGGEFLVADYAGFTRPFHLDYIRMPGGDRAVREPWRLALAWLYQAGLAWSDTLESVQHPSDEARRVVRHQIEQGVNAPYTSSMGRLFDAVAALAGIRQTVTYEAQAAIELEELADRRENGAYEFEISAGVIDPATLIRSVVADLRAGVTAPIISAKFHNGVARMVLAVCQRLRIQTELNQVALSGGVWQNMTLLAATVGLLQRDGFTVLVHRLVPANDGGLALGQAVVAANRLRRSLA